MLWKENFAVKVYEKITECENIIFIYAKKYKNQVSTYKVWYSSKYKSCKYFWKKEQDKSMNK